MVLVLFLIWYYRETSLVSVVLIILLNIEGIAIFNRGYTICKYSIKTNKIYLISISTHKNTGTNYIYIYLMAT